MSGTKIIGSNLTTPGAASAPSTMLVNHGTSPHTGLLIKQGSGAPAATVAWRALTAAGVTIAEMHFADGLKGYGIKIGATASVFRLPACLNGAQNPPCLELPDAITGNVWRLWSGTGAPSSSKVGTAAVGDWYLRRDTPSTANQRLYVCTVAGTPGTWVAAA